MNLFKIIFSHHSRRLSALFLSSHRSFTAGKPKFTGRNSLGNPVKPISENNRKQLLNMSASYVKK